MSYTGRRKRAARMNSESSNSDSDLSQVSLESPQPFRANHSQRITSVSTNPEEDAYVMVLQNKSGLYENLKSVHFTSLRDMYDVTFLVGNERTPVKGVRALIASRTRVFHNLIATQQEKLAASKRAKSNFKKAVTKIGKFACVRNSTGNTGLTISLATFDPLTFQRLMTYIHTGILTVDSSTAVGLLNAGYEFELPEVLQACWNFALGCTVREDNLQDLFESAKRYQGRKMTATLMVAVRSQNTHEFPTLLSHSATTAEFESSNKFEENESADSTTETDSSSSLLAP